MAAADFRRYCTCGILFLSDQTFSAHRAKLKKRCAPITGGITGIDARCFCGHVSTGPEDAIVHRVGCGGSNVADSVGGFRIHCSCGEELLNPRLTSSIGLKGNWLVLTHRSLWPLLLAV